MASDELTATFSFRKGGTFRWLSPERFSPEDFGLREARPTKESDCYALGMVIYEVLSGEVPFASHNSLATVMKLMKGERPKRPREEERGGLFTDDIWDALDLCWKPQPHDRISASGVLLRLEEHPPLLRPSSNVGGDVARGSGGRWTVLGGDQSDAAASYSSAVSLPDPWSAFTSSAFDDDQSDTAASDSRSDSSTDSLPSISRSRVFGDYQSDTAAGYSSAVSSPHLGPVFRSSVFDDDRSDTAASDSSTVSLGSSFFFDDLSDTAARDLVWFLRSILDLSSISLAL